MKRWEVETNRHLSVNSLSWGWIETDTRTLSVQWLGVAGRALAEAVARLWNANGSGMVLDLSELPESFDLRITRQSASGEPECFVELVDLGAEVYRTFASGCHTTPAEAYTAALKAWKENG